MESTQPCPLYIFQVFCWIFGNVVSEPDSAQWHQFSPRRYASEMGKTLARWSVELIFIVVHVKGMHLVSPIRTMLGLVAMGLMEKPPLLLRTTVVISSRSSIQSLP